MPDTLKKIGSVPHHDLYTADVDDILIVMPEVGFKDTPELSRVTLAALQEYATKLGKRCGLVIVVNNILAQEPESRRIYADGISAQLFYGVTMVVSSPLARIIGNLAVHLNTMQVPLILVESVEAGIAWLKTARGKV